MHFIISNTKKSVSSFVFLSCVLVYLETGLCTCDGVCVSVKTAMDRVKGFLQWMLLENTKMT